VITKSSPPWKGASPTTKQRSALSRKRIPNSEDNSRCKGKRTKSSSESRKKCTGSSSKIRGKRTKVSHCFPRVLAFINLYWVLKKLFTTELRKMLIYKEELLTDVKNLLYRCTYDIERLEKVISDTE
jgi:hypothetical protein